MKLLVCSVLLVVVAQASFSATSCTFRSVSPVSFGVYNVFDPLPNNNGVGSISIDCQGGGGSFDVTLSTGQSHTYAMRVMKSGAVNQLNYNLFTRAGRHAVWGDGTGTSRVMTASKNTQTRLDIFGQIPAGQDAAVGTYTDNITATVNF